MLGSATSLLLAAAIGALLVGTEPDAVVDAAAPSTAEAPPDTTPPSSTSSPPTSATLPPTTIPPATPPTTTPTTTTTTTTTTLPGLELAEDGLGLVDLGAGFDEALGVVSAELGPPSSDTGWIRAHSDLGTCPGTVVRVVRWESLRLYFSDGPTEFGEEVRHLFYYSQSIAETDTVVDLSTPEGITIGSTVADLAAAYGDRLRIESSFVFGVGFSVDPLGEAGLLSGTVTHSQPDGEVTSIAGGFGCGA